MDAERRSRRLTEGLNRAPCRSMHYGMGYSRSDLANPMIGVVNGHSTVVSSNAGIQSLADVVVEEVMSLNGNPQVIGMPGLGDAFATGPEDMKFGLVCRELIADCVETCVNSRWMDGVLLLGGSDADLAGGTIGMLRTNVPALFVYGGAATPSFYNGQSLDISSVRDAVSQFTAGTLSEEDLFQIEQRAVSGPGACGIMGATNSMSAALEALGLGLPYSATVSSGRAQVVESARLAARALVKAVEMDLKPRDIVTRESIENAVAIVVATGGSASAVLHVLALARAAEVEWGLDDFERIRSKVPVLCDVKPLGRYWVNDLHTAGGIPAVMRALNQAGLLHGHCMTVTGKTVAENLAEVPSRHDGACVIRQVDQAVGTHGHLAVLQGNLAPGGCVAGFGEWEIPAVSGFARVFDDEPSALDAIFSNRIRPGDVLVLRYLGPKGGPGMPEMLALTGALAAKGLGASVGVVTDGRCLAGSQGWVVGHVTPEAFNGGPIALVRDGDRITIDAASLSLQLQVDEAELVSRKAVWAPPEQQYRRGALARFARHVSSASCGAVLDI